ncbi:hypothetical protein, partial [Acidisphaera sp. L21]|uniref:hypothetical protein n=1 Tax=Acidisphaera sp. L21 TaxID=1641851 RepID=UPI001C202E06
YPHAPWKAAAEQRLRCTMSVTRQPMTIHLCETIYGPERPGVAAIHRRPAWEILLHDGIGETPSEAPAE